MFPIHWNDRYIIIRNTKFICQSNYLSIWDIYYLKEPIPITVLWSIYIFIQSWSLVFTVDKIHYLIKIEGQTRKKKTKTILKYFLPNGWMNVKMNGGVLRRTRTAMKANADGLRLNLKDGLKTCHRQIRYSLLWMGASASLSPHRYNLDGNLMDIPTMAILYAPSAISVHDSVW